MTTGDAAHPNGARPPMMESRSPAGQISIRPGWLLSVTGPLDGPGVEHLRGQLWAGLEAEAAFVALDLSAVTDCDARLFAVLADIDAALLARAGWMRLVGLSPAVLAALDTAPIPQILLVYRTSDRAHGRGGKRIPVDAVPAPASGPRHTDANR